MLLKGGERGKSDSGVWSHRRSQVFFKREFHRSDNENEKCWSRELLLVADEMGLLASGEFVFFNVDLHGRWLEKQCFLGKLINE